MTVELYHGDCLDIMPTLEENSVDTVIVDLPAGIAFMGKKWDNKRGYAPRSDKGKAVLEFGALLQLEPWEVGFVAFVVDCLMAAYRVMKPGAMCLLWALPRTSDLTGLAMRIAGLEVRDCIASITGQGFPKSLSIDKAIDKARNDDIYHVTAFVASARDAAGMSNADIDEVFGFHGMAGHWTSQKSQPAVPAWEQWQKLKTLLNLNDDMDEEVWRLNGRKGKPGDAWYEREIIQERIMIQGGGNSLCIREGERREVEANITAPATPAAKLWHGWGSGLKPAVEHWLLGMKPLDGTFANNALEWGCAGLWVDGGRIPTNGERPTGSGQRNGNGNTYHLKDWIAPNGGNGGNITPSSGRFPSNLILDESAAVLLDEMSGERPSGATKPGINTGAVSYKLSTQVRTGTFASSTGGASRFFFCTKAPKRERWFYCSICDDAYPESQRDDHAHGKERREQEHIFAHPTVKTLSLMRYLAKLTKTPTGGVVLDFCMGSGSTGVACILEGRDFIGIECEYPSFVVAQRRTGQAQAEMLQLELM